MSKNPSLAAILNFLVWGSGYLYKGERATFGWLLLIGYVFVHWYAFFSLGLAAAISGPYLTALLGHIVISIGLAYDVYSK